MYNSDEEGLYVAYFDFGGNGVLMFFDVLEKVHAIYLTGQQAYDNI